MLLNKLQLTVNFYQAWTCNEERIQLWYTDFEQLYYFNILMMTQDAFEIVMSVLHLWTESGKVLAL